MLLPERDLALREDAVNLQRDERGAADERRGAGREVGAVLVDRDVHAAGPMGFLLIKDPLYGCGDQNCTHWACYNDNNQQLLVDYNKVILTEPWNESQLLSHIFNTHIEMEDDV